MRRAPLPLLLFIFAPVVAAPPAGDDAFLALTIRGKAHFENRLNQDAVNAFRKALALRPDEPAARQNLALALMRTGDHAAAALELQKVADQKPDWPSAHYLLGLCRKHLGDFPAATAALERALALDPLTVQVRYQLATVYKSAGRHDRAREEFREVVRRDPLFDSAFYQLAMYARQAGDTEQAQKDLLEMRRVRTVLKRDNIPPDFLELCRHTIPIVPAPAAPPAPSIPVRFVDVTAEAGLAPATTRPAATRPAAACPAVALIDADADGPWDVLAADAAGLRLYLNSAGTFRDHTAAAGLSGTTPAAEVLAPADFDNDGRTDLFACGPAGPGLLHARPDGTFADVTRAAGLADARAADALWLDYDVDGDLDLLVADPRRGVRLFQNRGNATFADVTTDTGLPADTKSIRRLAAFDVEPDDAPDLLLAGPDRTWLLRNLREGRFAASPAVQLRGATALTVDGFANDGLPRAVIATADDTSAVAFDGSPPAIIAGPLPQPHAALPLDFDNDGWTDLLLASDAAPGGLRLLRNEGPAGWRDRTADAGFDAFPHRPAQLAAADLDGDGDTDFLVATDAGPRLLRNDGGNARRQLKLRLVGSRSNRDGRGVRVEVRAGAFRADRIAWRTPVEIGVAAHDKLDSVQTVWNTGVVQHELDARPDPARPLEIKEKNVALGSCPYLYAWNGSRFEFITDTLGNAPAGLPFAPDRFLPADTAEYVRVGPVESFPPRDGRFVLRATDELREIYYLDCARLAVVDRPADCEVHSTSKVMPPPFEPPTLLPVRDVRPVRAARDHLGRDHTRELSAIDGDFAEPGEPLDPPLRGMWRPYELLLDFGPLDERRPLVLLLTGWLQWGGASLNIALAQNPDAEVILAALDAQTPDGHWQPVDVTVGLPAGRTKTIVADLSGRLPPATQRLRFRSSFEVRWDRAAIGRRADAAALRITHLDPVRADLAFRGFSEIRARRPGHPQTPDHEHVAPRPPWRRDLAGWCTRYGDVRELLLDVDDRYVILNSGDAVTMEFDAAALPPPIVGRQRELFFFSDGWDKDGDLHIRTGQTVTPLPFHGMDDQAYGRTDRPTAPELTDWNEQWNTRFVPPDRFDPDRAPLKEPRASVRAAVPIRAPSATP